jgi:hypothetical protein
MAPVTSGHATDPLAKGSPATSTSCLGADRHGNCPLRLQAVTVASAAARSAGAGVPCSCSRPELRGSCPRQCRLCNRAYTPRAQAPWANGTHCRVGLSRTKRGGHDSPAGTCCCSPSGGQAWAVELSLPPSRLVLGRPESGLYHHLYPWLTLSSGRRCPVPRPDRHEESSGADRRLLGHQSAR